MSDKTTPGAGVQLPPQHVPANLPPEILLDWLKQHRETTYIAHALPPCFRLKLGEVPRAIPMKGWSIFAINGQQRRVVMLGLSEQDANARADALNAAVQATGFHHWS